MNSRVVVWRVVFWRMARSAIWQIVELDESCIGMVRRKHAIPINGKTLRSFRERRRRLTAYLLAKLLYPSPKWQISRI